jgi:HK97 family phage major capsid protein
MNTTTLPDVGSITDNTKLLSFLGAAKSAVEAAAGDMTALNSTVEKLSAEFRALQEAADAPKIVDRAVTGTERDLGRYVRADGSVRLLGGVEPMAFKGASRTLTVQVETKGLLDDPELASQWQKELQSAIGERHMLRLATGKAATPYADAKVASLVARAPEHIRDAVARAFVDSAGSGAEWIPDRFSPEVYQAFEAPSTLSALVSTVSLAGPTVKPKVTGQARAYKLSGINGDDPAVLTPCSITTSNQTLSAEGLYVRMVVDRIASEDSAIPVVSWLQSNMVKTVVDSYEDAMVNGDTAGTHQDAIASWNARGRWGASGLGGSADHRRIMLGWRALAYDRSGTVDQGSGQTVAKILEELFGGMGEIAMQEGVIVCSPEVYFKKLMLDTSVTTVDKLGALATLVRGQLASVAGRPVIVSRWVTADLAATGLYSGAGNSKSGVLAVVPGAFAHYQRRGPSVEIEATAKTQSTDLVITQRKSMDTLTASTEKVAMFGFNWL